MYIYLNEQLNAFAVIRSKLTCLIVNSDINTGYIGNNNKSLIVDQSKDQSKETGFKQFPEH